MNAAPIVMAACLAAACTEPAFPAQIHEKPTQMEETPSRALQGLLADYWEMYLQENPQLATVLGDKRYNDRWQDLSENGRIQSLSRRKDFASRLGRIRPGELSPPERLSADLLKREMSEYRESARFFEWEMPVNQIHGIHFEIPQLVAVTPFDDEKDYANYVARLKQLPHLFDQLISSMRRGIADKRTQPALISEKVLAQVDAVLSTTPADSPFAEPASHFPETVPPERRMHWKSAISGALESDVIPAYKRFADFLRAEYIPHGRRAPGIWAIPEGDAYYAFCIRRNTTVNLSAAEIHRIGEREVRRDEEAMTAIASKLGFRGVQDLDHAISDDPALHAKSAAAVLDAYRSSLDQMREQLPRLFGVLPKASLIVEATPSYTERQRPPATYEPGSPDGQRPGRVVVNTFDFAHIRLIEAESIAYHEGIPGHHLQISLAQEAQGLPEFRRHLEYTAYTEGWAMYAEQLGKEAGFYRDPYSDFGRLEGDIWRAIRLVVDTGLHSEHWTRQQVVDYFHDHSAIDEVNVQRETDRYIAWPGQALGYKIGQIKLLELRQRAQSALGARFDLKKFHDLVLASGAVPLDVLSAEVDQWIASQGR